MSGNRHMLDFGNNANEFENECSHWSTPNKLIAMKKKKTMPNIYISFFWLHRACDQRGKMHQEHIVMITYQKIRWS